MKIVGVHEARRLFTAALFLSLTLPCSVKESPLLHVSFLMTSQDIHMFYHQSLACLHLTWCRGAQPVWAYFACTWLYSMLRNWVRLIYLNKMTLRRARPDDRGIIWRPFHHSKSPPLPLFSLSTHSAGADWEIQHAARVCSGVFKLVFKLPANSEHLVLRGRRQPCQWEPLSRRQLENSSPQGEQGGECVCYEREPVSAGTTS